MPREHDIERICDSIESADEWRDTPSERGLELFDDIEEAPYMDADA